MNFKQLRYFTRIVEMENMSRAAESLNVAQTALGFQMRNLEEELGVPLLERHSRGVRTTEAGQLLYRRAKEILIAIESTIQEVRQTSAGPRPSLIVGLTTSIMSSLDLELFTITERHGLKTKVNYTEALSFSLISALLRDEINFALAFNVPETPGIIRTPLLDEPLFYITPSTEPAPKEPVSFSHALRGELALVSHRDNVWDIVHRVADYLSLDFSVAFEVRSTSAIKTLVARGVATSIMPYGIVSKEVEEGVLRAQPIDDPRAIRTLFFIHPHDRLEDLRGTEQYGLVQAILNEYSEFLDRNSALLSRM